MNTTRNTLPKIQIEPIEMSAAFWQGDDITADIDHVYLQRLHARLGEMVWQLYEILPNMLRPESVHDFIGAEIAGLYQSLCRGHMIETYRDFSGRRRHGEDAYFFWLRQRVLLKLFFPAIAYILQTPVTAFHRDDNAIFRDKDFTPEERILVDMLDGEQLQVEVIFDTDSSHTISPWRVAAAKKEYRITGRPTLRFHIDLPQKTGALFLLNQLAEKGNPLVIPAVNFIWNLSEVPPIFPEETNGRLFA